MKVKELIELLQKHDPQMDVCVDDCEYGITELKEENISVIGTRRGKDNHIRRSDEHREDDTSKNCALVLSRYSAEW